MSDLLHQLRQVIDDRLRRVNVCLPARVDSYDATTRTASVTPLVRERYADGTELTPPSIAKVPVVMPGGSSFGLCLPIGTGDTVLVVFSQRSIDEWKSDGGSVDPQDGRMHSLADAIAIAGLFAPATSHVDGDGVVLYNDLVKIRLEGGQVAIGTSVVELLDRLTVALDNLALAYAAIPFDPATIVAVSTAIKTIKGTI